MLTASAASSIPMTRPMTPAPVVPISREIGSAASRIRSHGGENSDSDHFPR
jgi:hypothetical protein